jgi:hypothetical protein
MWPLAKMEELLKTLIDLDRQVKSRPYSEDSLASSAGTV